MQNSFLMTKCDQRSSNNNNSFMQIQPDGRSSCAVSEIQNSENELNMGFIAEDSEIVLSESHSLTDLSIQKVQSMECGSPEFN